MKALIALAVFLLGGGMALTKPRAGAPPAAPAEELLDLAGELRIAIYYTALAIYAPTPEDRELYARRVIDLIAGGEGDRFAAGPPGKGPPRGMLARLDAISDSLLPRIPTEKRRAVMLVLENVRIFLEFALREAVSAARSGDMESGAEHMRKAYAFLNAAWGAEVISPYLGGVWLLLRHLGLEAGRRRPHPGMSPP